MNQSEFIDKPASAWELQDLKERVLAEEGPYLEFKKTSEFIKNGQFAWDTFSEEVAETVSAFLNANGGVLLIGVQTDKAPGDRRTESLKSLEAWAADQTFEHLKVSLTTSQVRDRIYGNIMPRPFGVEVKALDVPSGGVQTKVFVVTVPASVLGAHQSVRTQRYYRRTSDGDVPMLDYEIKDVNNRRAGPLLDLACAVFKDKKIYEEEEWKTSSTQTRQASIQGVQLSRVEVVFATTNFGRGTANIVKFDVGIPQPWEVNNYSPEGTNAGAFWVSNSPSRYVLGNRAVVFWKPERCHEVPPLQRRKRSSEQMIAWQTVIYNGNDAPAHPVWPTTDRVVVGVLELQLPLADINDTWWWLPWRIFTEGMPETRGVILMKGASGLFQVVNYEMDDVSWWGEAEDMQRFNTLKDKFNIQ